MSKLPTATTASSTLADQEVAANLTVGVMTDPDDGQLMLVAATQGNQGDLQVVTPAQALAKVNVLREQADRAEALINEYAEKVLVPAFLAEFGIELEELDIASLIEDAPDLAAAFRAFAAVKNDGSIIAAVPKGQAPTERLTALRDLVLDLHNKEQA